jgi:hypothetical protein
MERWLPPHIYESIDWLAIWIEGGHLVNKVVKSNHVAYSGSHCPEFLSQNMVIIAQCVKQIAMYFQKIEKENLQFSDK